MVTMDTMVTMVIMVIMDMVTMGILMCTQMSPSATIALVLDEECKLMSSSWYIFKNSSVIEIKLG